MVELLPQLSLSQTVFKVNFHCERALGLFFTSDEDPVRLREVQTLMYFMYFILGSSSLYSR